jgi:osmotically-inducible protein OsmY
MIKEHAMNISYTKRILAICAYLGLAAYGLAASAARADAPNVAADQELRQRVTAALHSDPYFYDEHVSVSVENGVVVLRGFVASEWDIRDALRIAGKAAGDSRVVDDLSIEQGGRR